MINGLSYKGFTLLESLIALTLLLTVISSVVLILMRSSENVRTLNKQANLSIIADNVVEQYWATNRLYLPQPAKENYSLNVKTKQNGQLIKIIVQSKQHSDQKVTRIIQKNSLRQ